MKKNVFLLCVMMVAIMVASCDKEIDKGNHPEGPIDEQLIGRWVFDHRGDITRWDNYDAWEFYSNGNCSRVSIRDRGRTLYQWTAENNVLRLRYNDSYTNLRYVIKNGLLTFDIDTPDDQTTWFKKVNF